VETVLLIPLNTCAEGNYAFSRGWQRLSGQGQFRAVVQSACETWLWSKTRHFRRRNGVGFIAMLPLWRGCDAGFRHSGAPPGDSTSGFRIAPIAWRRFSWPVQAFWFLYYWLGSFML